MLCIRIRVDSNEVRLEKIRAPKWDPLVEDDVACVAGTLVLYHLKVRGGGTSGEVDLVLRSHPLSFYTRFQPN
jgi:hypothetical protein